MQQGARRMRANNHRDGQMVASGCAALRRAWGVAPKARRKLRRIHAPQA